MLEEEFGEGGVGVVGGVEGPLEEGGAGEEGGGVDGVLGEPGVVCGGGEESGVVEGAVGGWVAVVRWGCPVVLAVVVVGAIQ